MSALITVLFYIMIILIVIKKLKNRTGTSAIQKVEKKINTVDRNINKNISKTVDVSAYKAAGRNKAAGVNKHMARERSNVKQWEDRRNDWLAGQMNDERQAQRRVSEMFQLKMEHRYSCEAEMLKQFHESHCDADDVDNAQT